MNLRGAFACALVCYTTMALFGCRACSSTDEAATPTAGTSMPPSLQERDALQSSPEKTDAGTTGEVTQLVGCEAFAAILELAATFRRRPWDYYPPESAVNCERGVCDQARAEDVGLLGLGWTEARPGGSHFFVEWWNPTNFRCDSLGLETARTDPKTERCEKIPRGPLAGMTVAFDHRGHCMMIFDDAYERVDPAAATPFICDHGDERAAGPVVHCANVSWMAAGRPDVK